MRPRSQYAGNVPDCRVGPWLLSHYLVSGNHLAAEPGERHRVTIVDAHVPGFEKLEMHTVIGDSDVPERGTERLGTEVKVVLVSRARVDPDGPQPAQRVRVRWHHLHRVPVQPPLPYCWTERSGRGGERQGRATAQRCG